MKIAGKKWSYYWSIVRVPVVILVLLHFAGLVIGDYSRANYRIGFFGGIAIWVLPVVIYLLVGWNSVKRHNGSVGDGTWAGLLTGVIAGLADMVAMWILINVERAVAVLEHGTTGILGGGGMYSADSLILTIVLFPFWFGVQGALLSAVGAWVAKKMIAQKTSQ
jgi:hypothetical protein